MRILLTIFAAFSFLVSNSQTVSNTDYENIQGKWICITPKYKKHTFWVKKLSFFQNYNKEIVEQELPYQIENSNGENIEIVGLFVKCSGCYDDVWTITKLTSSVLELVNNETDETAIYNKILKTTNKKKKNGTQH